MIKKIIIVLTIIVSLLLVSCKKNNEFINDYPQLKGQNHLFKYTTADSVINNLNSNFSGIIVFGFVKCPWCQAAVPYINEIAKEKGFDTVFYLDIKDMRDNENSPDRQKYLEIFEIIKWDIGNPDNIIAPTVICFKNGEIMGYNVATVSSHQLNENNILPPMNDEQIMELKEIYQNIFIK